MNHTLNNTRLDINGIDYKKDAYLEPSYQMVATIRNIKQRINANLFAPIITTLEQLEHIFEMFDILVLRSPHYISAYNRRGTPLLINPAFLNIA